MMAAARRLFYQVFHQTTTTTITPLDPTEYKAAVNEF